MSESEKNRKLQKLLLQEQLNLVYQLEGRKKRPLTTNLHGVLLIPKTFVCSGDIV